MRIRKRTPARAASPGPTRHRAESPPPQQQLKERPHEKEVEEDKASLPVVGVGEEEDLVPAASERSATGVQKQKPDSEPATHGASTAALPARCTRNDGKRWRCKNEAVPGYMLCDGHMAWSTRRRRRPRASNKNRSGRVKHEAAMEASNLPCDGGGDEFSYYGGGGFQPGSPKRARNGGARPAP
ncbi:uncharacterized protein LOC124681636 [Lolium rigidum]|uniref:uncharacterized protein LOC124681636 n=1 Tax=Lolium rigidum TaxID=89674 RepID=UPI001F5C3F85|nr:uncharacterized protein LOC124681636 [Lolium rigidum]